MSRLGSQRGVTLTEVMVVMILASLVMVGLVTFYINSQATWMEASTQALTQREGTLLLERIAARVHSATDAKVTGPSGQNTLTLQQAGSINPIQYRWDPTDSSVLEIDVVNVARPTTVSSKVERFEVLANSQLVYIRELVLVTPTGQRVRMGSTMRLYNVPNP